MPITPKNEQRYAAALEIAKAILTKAHAERLMEWQEETVYTVLKERKYEWDRKAKRWVLADADASDLPNVYHDHNSDEYELRISARPEHVARILASLQDRLITCSKPYPNRHTRSVRVYAVCKIAPASPAPPPADDTNAAKVFSFTPDRLTVLLPDNEVKRAYIRDIDERVMRFECNIGDVVDPAFLDFMRENRLWLPNIARNLKVRVISHLYRDYSIHCKIEGWPMLFCAEVFPRPVTTEEVVKEIQQTGRCDMRFQWRGGRDSVAVYITSCKAE